MYDKVSTSLNFVDNEKEVMKFWEEKKVFEYDEVVNIFKKMSDFKEEESSELPALFNNEKEKFLIKYSYRTSCSVIVS